MKIELQKNFDTRKEAEIFNEFIAGFGSKCIKSVYCCFVNVIFVKIHIKETCSDEDYNMLVKIFEK
jgi:hypothetical protein